MPRNSYTFEEVERILESGDIDGRLSKEDLPTPALVCDLDAFEWNIRKMVQHTKDCKRALRPHAKTHKCPDIANTLVRAGAVGACAAKLSEAEVLAANGVGGLLVTAPVIGRHKIARAVRLARNNRDIIFTVDDARNVREVNDAVSALHSDPPLVLNLAIDLLITPRTGVAPGKPALELVRLIDTLPCVRFVGIQAYDATASHTEGFDNRKRRSRETMGLAAETRFLLEREGLECPLVTGGSTGTYSIDSELEGVTEIQPGSFIFMDVEYCRIGGPEGPAFNDFRNSLFVIATVIHRREGIAIVDAGVKSFSTDRPLFPEPRGLRGVQYAWAGDEYGRLDLSKSRADLKPGDRVEFIIPHCDPSVNLYDHIYGLRNDVVELAWKVAARGMSQ
jgi:D-serine deaminase-like pyridoxal phosphate-dependent protein